LHIFSILIDISNNTISDCAINDQATSDPGSNTNKLMNIMKKRDKDICTTTGIATTNIFCKKYSLSLFIEAAKTWEAIQIEYIQLEKFDK